MNFSRRGKDVPIIPSLTWIDFYKFTMGYFIWKYYKDLQVKFAFKNRTVKVKLGKHISKAQFKEELEHVRSIRGVGNTELNYLRGVNIYKERMFEEDYLTFLRHLRLPDYFFEVDKKGNLIVEISGAWAEVTYWETIILTIVNTLYYENLTAKYSTFELDRVFAEGINRLGSKIDLLRQYPAILFADFSTRRAFCPWWQDYGVARLAEEMPKQFIGTSNTYLAIKYDLNPIGTNAHELPMTLAAYFESLGMDVTGAHFEMLEKWWQLYGFGLSIALTDTFGTNFFLRNFSPAQAELWKGFRQDSGDPFQFGFNAIKFYTDLGLNPKEKLIVFSDGLDVDSIVKLHQTFNGLIKASYGWGTNLMNDLGFGALSIVMKVIEACGMSTVKLSDNIAKSIGELAKVEMYKKAFDYHVKFNQTCVY